LRGYEAKCSGSEEDLIGIVLQHAPDVVVYLLTDGSHWDLAVLQLLRRVRPLVPLILVSADASVRMRLAVLGLRPTYLAMSPEETGEILEAIEAVLR
jgi:DNA-binding NarL/FixJ family response regulator